MPWFKVDDKLHDHRKTRKAGKAAMGVWVLAGSWSMDNETDGFVPDDVLARWGTKADAGRLVAAGFWYADEFNGERGWRFHDWAHFQPSAAVTAAKRAAEHEAGLRGNHNRWHVKRKITDPDCEYCYRVPDQVPDGEPEAVPESAPIPPEPVPLPLPHVEPDGSTRRPKSTALAQVDRPEVESICEHLASRMEGNGLKRPSITKVWRDAARLMLDKDGRTEHEIHGAIDWCQDDEFWRSNILSLPKLREQYERLRLQAQRKAAPARKNDIDWDAAFARAEALDQQRGEIA